MCNDTNRPVDRRGTDAANKRAGPNGPLATDNEHLDTDNVQARVVLGSPCDVKQPEQLEHPERKGHTTTTTEVRQPS